MLVRPTVGFWLVEIRSGIVNSILVRWSVNMSLERRKINQYIINPRGCLPEKNNKSLLAKHGVNAATN